MTVQKDARLHEQAVQKVARGELTPKRRGRGPDQRSRQKVEVVRPRLHEEIRARIAGVDPRHIQILSPTDVVIWNGPPEVWP